MKTLFIVFAVAIGLLAWRADDLAFLLEGTLAKKPASELAAQDLLIEEKPGASGMTIEQFAELSKTDPEAYQKLLASRQQPVEGRSAVDKLMNLLANGKYE